MSYNYPIRIVPLGGMPNVHDNMYVYESADDIFIVDCGMGFPDEGVPGVDLTIPDITYLKDKISKIRGFVVTHGHEDHIGGFPYIIPELGGQIPIYASKLTAGFIREKFREFDIDLRLINVVGDRQPIQLGIFEVKMIPVTHSVPDTKHLVIKTPYGNIYHGSDFKFDWTPVGQELPDIQSITRAGAEGVTLLLSDCLRGEKKGYSLSEASVEDSLEREFRDESNRVVLTTMSSNISRIQQALWVAKRNNRKVAFVGFSIERNVKVAAELGFLKIPPRLVIDKRKIAALPKNEQCLIIAGSQGQLGSSLEKIATGEHKVVHLDPGDKVIFSSDPIPGNEANVYRLVDMLSAHQLEVIYYDIADDLHVSGHASSSELMMLIAMTKPKYVLPTGGTYRHMIQYGKLAAKMGLASDHILMPENQVIVLEPTGIVHYGEKLDIKSVYVESGQIFRSDAPLTDRKLMYQEGVVIAAITIRQHTLDLDLIPKGLTPPVGNDILSDIKGQLLTILRPDDITRDKLYSKDRIAKEVSRLFVAKIGKNPLVIPIIIES
ncbi:MAG: RNA-metabolising metallo-beta-lactamase [Microgenomates group bacterium GW2011_GWC1_46_16]|uniref:Metallo-beta-lactamase domain-containing protein n=1 Tax=Candidatus Collierbacteria bacterium RIFOXYD1_FULL_46_26 TaxID=1817732 RepID=A0A1F5FXI5_9BACT|nr:MAG: RNA-metabolising metallo-beta-lactamase [Microgenomates group bacterium GW2011_GWF1_46_12]KKU26916.1 MAG: RNA-metabolising metallo-beta-lactamase [Microgenomates group bacterium GW2011_GWC1_46_16]KKU28333.1 MAG: RNA-metabolising metallo-beta-lactamase [Microgenomates group bacterium GW2011_GWF2_46_18]KKU43802.1 MAG: RNA-metabolising metallo-beta-lactamase [Microgenomates group bacterium GW2011_GWA1_46_7]KKU45205.1 MAG: RNA-metabolising metallo-beta-lactamase [Microgenomates group bacter